MRRRLDVLGTVVATGLAGVAFAGVPGVTAQAIAGDSTCISCHVDLEDEQLARPAITFPDDIHYEAGFGCLDCHGSTDVHGEPGLSFLARPERRDVPGLCGSCHSDARLMRDFNPALRVDQETEYATSVHGRLLAEANDPDVPTCVTCHVAHATRPASEVESPVHPTNVGELCSSCHSDADLMAPRGHTDDPFEDYRNSVHGTLMYDEGDISAPTCNDCHGNHGAAPPGVFSIGNVCGQCHTVMMDLFDASGHSEYFEDEGLSGCATCHDNHAIEPPSDELLLEARADNCLLCHTEAETASAAFPRILTLIDSLEHEREASRQVLEEAEDLGMEVEDAVFRLDEVSNALTRARNAVHSFAVAPVREEIASGLAVTASAREEGVEALEEHRFRRVGLGVSSGIIVILIMALGLKIRSIEARMNEILDQVDSFSAEHLAEAGRWGESEHSIQLAAAAVFLEFAYADDTLEDVEQDRIETLVRRHFDLGTRQAEDLIRLAEHEREQGADMHAFAARINDKFDTEAKHALMESIWTLVMSDGRLAEQEAYLLREIARDLGLEDWRAKETTSARGGDTT